MSRSSTWSGALVLFAGCLSADGRDKLEEAGDTSLPPSSTAADGDADADADPDGPSNDGDGDGLSTPADCDDDDDTIYPGAVDVVGDAVDQNCDGIDGVDGDGDGYASLASGGDDCADGDSAVHPGGTESCLTVGVDDDCDGSTDALNATACTTYYLDADRDGYGVTTEAHCTCAAEGDYDASTGGDCYDLSAAAYPGQTLYFGVDRGDGSYDYDCSGTESGLYTTIGECPGTWNYNIECPAPSPQGWLTSIPTCGAADHWVDYCYPNLAYGGCMGIEALLPLVTQECR